MPRYFEISGNEILGYGQGPTMPQDPRLVLADDDAFALYQQASEQMAATRQPGRPLWNDGAIAAPADLRPYLSITADKDAIAADGVDSATVTVAFLNADDTVNTAINGAQIFATQSGRHWRLEFVDGVATKTFTTTKSGAFDIESTDAFRLREPFQIIAWE